MNYKLIDILIDTYPNMRPIGKDSAYRLEISNPKKRGKFQLIKHKLIDYRKKMKISTTKKLLKSIFKL